MFSSVFCIVFLHAEPLLAHYLEPTMRGWLSKILLRDLWWSSWPTAKCNKIQELIASFSTLRLDANLSLFTNTDIVPYHLSHHYLLNSNNLPTPLLPLSPPDSSFFLIPLSLLTHSLLTPISQPGQPGNPFAATTCLWRSSRSTGAVSIIDPQATSEQQ